MLRRYTKRSSAAETQLGKQDRGWFNRREEPRSTGDVTASLTSFSSYVDSSSSGNIVNNDGDNGTSETKNQTQLSRMSSPFLSRQRTLRPISIKVPYDGFIVSTKMQKADLVAPMKERIEAEIKGYSCFFDSDMLPHEGNPLHIMEDAVESSRHVFVVMSKALLQKKDPCAEIVYAHRRMKWLRDRNQWHSLFIVMYDMTLDEYKELCKREQLGKILPPIRNEVIVFEYSRNDEGVPRGKYACWNSVCDALIQEILKTDQVAFQQWKEFLSRWPNELDPSFPSSVGIYDDSRYINIQRSSLLPRVERHCWSSSQSTPKSSPLRPVSRPFHKQERWSTKDLDFPCGPSSCEEDKNNVKAYSCSVVPSLPSIAHGQTQYIDGSEKAKRQSETKQCFVNKKYFLGGKEAWYSGELNMKGQRHGQGLLVWADSVGKRHPVQLAKNTYYEGNFHENRYTGEGKLYIAEQKRLFLGTFDRGIPNGYGDFFDDTLGLHYKGDFLDGVPHGRGQCVYEKLDRVFDGRWAHGAPATGTLTVRSSGKIKQETGPWDKTLEIRAVLAVCNRKSCCHNESRSSSSEGNAGRLYWQTGHNSGFSPNSDGVMSHDYGFSPTSDEVSI